MFSGKIEEITFSPFSYKLRLIEPGNIARKVNCCCVYSAYILKPVLPGRNL